MWASHMRSGLVFAVTAALSDVVCAAWAEGDANSWIDRRRWLTQNEAEPYELGWKPKLERWLKKVGYELSVDVEDLKVLNLLGKDLEPVDDGIWNLIGLEELVLISCDLKYPLSEKIKNLTNLRKLHLDGNPMLTSLPNNLCRLPKLEKLSITDMNLKSWPAGMGNSASLRTLSFSAKDVELLRQACEFDNLEALHLHNYILKSLPAEIGNLANLKTLSVSGQGLKSLPAEIGNLTNLKTLSVSGEELELLPASIIGLQDKIKALNLSKCPKLKASGKQEGMLGWVELWETYGAKASLPEIWVDWDDVKELDVVKEWLSNDEVEGLQGVLRMMTQKTGKLEIDDLSHTEPFCTVELNHKLKQKLLALIRHRRIYYLNRQLAGVSIEKRSGGYYGKCGAVLRRWVAWTGEDAKGTLEELLNVALPESESLIGDAKDALEQWLAPKEGRLLGTIKSGRCFVSWYED